MTPAPDPAAVTGEAAGPGRAETGALVASLRAAMPGMRGALEAEAPLAPLSWFRTGGPAEALFTPADEDDLALFLAGCPVEVPLLVIGLGSNLLIRDRGVPGVVVRLGRGFARIAVEEGCQVRAGAAAPDVKVARAAAEAGIDGLTFLRGIPGQVGGVLRMNGGAYGGETADVLVAARALDRRGRPVTLSRDEMGFAYRHCAAPDDLIFTEALFEGRPGEPAAIASAMAAITEQRSATQPVNTRTGGSTFKNPLGAPALGAPALGAPALGAPALGAPALGAPALGAPALGAPASGAPVPAKAWELIDRAGCRGLRRGAAQVSELHCNFLINHGGATAAEIEGLGEEVRRRVREATGVTLAWEIKRVGVPGPAM